MDDVGRPRRGCRPAFRRATAAAPGAAAPPLPPRRLRIAAAGCGRAIRPLRGLGRRGLGRSFHRSGRASGRRAGGHRSQGAYAGTGRQGNGVWGRRAHRGRTGSASARSRRARARGGTLLITAPPAEPLFPLFPARTLAAQARLAAAAPIVARMKELLGERVRDVPARVLVEDPEDACEERIVRGACAPREHAEEERVEHGRRRARRRQARAAWRGLARQHVEHTLAAARWQAWERLFALWHVLHLPFGHPDFECHPPPAARRVRRLGVAAREGESGHHRHPLSREQGRTGIPGRLTATHKLTQRTATLDVIAAGTRRHAKTALDRPHDFGCIGLRHVGGKTRQG